MYYEKPGHIEIKGGKLQIAGIDASTLAAKYGTPLYVYNGDRIVSNFNTVRDALEKHADRKVRVQYAVKANTSLAILKLLAAHGACADVVSPFEAMMCIDSGFLPESIHFTGTSVSRDDLLTLTGLKVKINVDSFAQMRALAEMRPYNVSIRWNPGEGVGHHEHVITAGKYVKFGIPEEKIIEAFIFARNLGLKPVGLHQHVGSGVLEKDIATFIRTVEKTLDIAGKVNAQLGEDLDYVNFGGGLGIPYTPDEKPLPVDEFIAALCERVHRSGVKFETIVMEPGRYIVADAGILLCTINTVEEKGVPVIGVDAGFGTLVRPAFYEAYHEIVICDKADHRPENEWLVAGNLCESGDVFNETKYKLRPLPKPDEGDILAILDTGAYGFSMASRYNSRPLPEEVLIVNGEDRLVRKRDTYEEHVRGQVD